jgi:hypothetical protein
MEDNTFYVYVHFDMETHDIVYIGKGKYGRAWDVTRARGDHKEHQEWMMEMCRQGYVPSDWVSIAQSGMTEKEALELEKRMLHNTGVTRFNRQGGQRNHMSKLTDKQAIEIFIRCKNGEGHQKLADEFKVSRSAVSMIASRKQWKTVTAGL